MRDFKLDHDDENNPFFLFHGGYTHSRKTEDLCRVASMAVATTGALNNLLGVHSDEKLLL